MARITRTTLKVFGDTGPTADFNEYGSFKAGTVQTSKDPTTIQQLSAWGTGMKGSVLDGNRAMPLEDMNAVLYVHSLETAYLLQDGIAEWDPGTTYYKFSVVKKPGTFELYGSLTDGNVNQALPSQANNTNWQFLNPPSEPTGTVKMWAGAEGTVPFGYLLCDGSAVSRTSFAALFTIVGTTYGAGNGSTTFNLPNMRGRMPIGGGVGSGLTQRVVGTFYGVEQHSHGIGSHKHKTTAMYNPGNTGRVVDIGNIFGLSGTHNGGAGATFGGTASIDSGYNYQLTDNPEAGATTVIGGDISPALAINFIIKS